MKFEIEKQEFLNCSKASGNGDKNAGCSGGIGRGYESTLYHRQNGSALRLNKFLLWKKSSSHSRVICAGVRAPKRRKLIKVR